LPGFFPSLRNDRFDSSARSMDGPTCKGKPHPRGFGTFPRFLGRYARDQRQMSLGKGIHKMTMLPAETFGLKARGCIREGYMADLVIFDDQRIKDRATFEEPFLKPEGIHYVLVNGSPVVWEARQLVQQQEGYYGMGNKRVAGNPSSVLLLTGMENI